MKKYCEKEPAVVAALRSGPLYDELFVHAGNCPVCSEVLLVTEFLREEIASAQDARMPDAARIWQCAQNRAREKAVLKATLPIRIARTLAGVVAVVAMPWLVLVLVKLPLRVPDLGLRYFLLLDWHWSPTVTSSTLLSVTVTLICIGFSSWYILREE
jgi:hypothetical protein